jgi:hypothetical protein
MSDSKIDQNNGRFLKTETTPEDVKMYELYLERLGNEADLIWRRFQVFWGGTSVLFIAMAFLLTSSFHGQNGQSFSFGFSSFDTWKLVLDICLLGLISSVFWVLASINSNRRQKVISNAIKDIENDIFVHPEQTGIGHRIAEKQPGFNGLEIAHISIYLSCLYGVIFIVLIFITSRMCV